MMPLIFKEVRENLRWALLAMVLLGGGELYALYHTGDQPYYNYILSGITLCSTSFLDVTTFGCAAVGFLLGLVQILPELKRDRWASLLHRPVSRGVIFRGKALAGLLLYSLAAVTPFLLSIWLVTTPGKFGAPFVPKMVFPGSADICMGGVYYCAALALGLQRGGWAGLRVFPLLAAVHATYFVLDNKLFYVAVEAAVLMGLALFTAAWGEMQNQDALRARPWLGKCGFLAVVIYGVCGLGDIARSFCTTLIAPSGPNFYRYEITQEGVPLRVTYSSSGVVLSVRDLAGKAVTDPRYLPDRAWNNVNHLNTFSEYIGDAHGFKPRRYQPTYREARSYLWADNPSFGGRVEQWFTLVEQNYLVDYLPGQKIAIAVLDRHGFEPAGAEAEGFPPQVTVSYAGTGPRCLWDAKHAQCAFLGARRIVDLTLPDASLIYGVGSAWARTDNSSVSVFGLAMGNGLAVYNDKAALLTYLPYHRQTDRWGQISMGVNRTLDRFYLRYDPSAWISDETSRMMPSFFEVVDLHGQVLHDYTLPPLPDVRRPPSWDTVLARRLQSPAFFFGTMVYKEVGAELGSARLRGDLAYQWGRDRRVTVETSLYVIGLSLLLAGATFFWAKRVYFPPRRAWAWTCFVLAFGLPGFITFRLAADWPRFVLCPNCGSRRPIDTGNCPHCGRDWPAPPSTGIEIFDQPQLQPIAAAPI
jgi:hypothetical protein